MRRRKERLKIVECKCESKLIFQLVRWFDTPRIGLVVASNLICPSFLYQVQVPELVIKTEKSSYNGIEFQGWILVPKWGKQEKTVISRTAGCTFMSAP